MQCMAKNMGPLASLLQLWKELFLRQLHPLFWARLAVFASVRVALLAVQTSWVGAGEGLPLGFYATALVLSAFEAPVEVSLARFHIRAYYAVKRAFTARDADHDGRVTLDELHGVAEDVHPAHQLWIRNPAVAEAASGFTLDDVLAMRRNHDSHNGMLAAASLAFWSTWIAYVGSLMVMRDAQGAMLAVSVLLGVVSVNDCWALLVRFVLQYVSAFLAPPTVCYCLSLASCVVLFILVPLLVLLNLTFVVVTVVNFAVPESDMLAGGVPAEFAPGFYSGLVLTAVIVGVVVNVVVLVKCVQCCHARHREAKRALGRPNSGKPLFLGSGAKPGRAPQRPAAAAVPPLPAGDLAAANPGFVGR